MLVFVTNPAASKGRSGSSPDRGAGDHGRGMLRDTRGGAHMARRAAVAARRVVLVSPMPADASRRILLLAVALGALLLTLWRAGGRAALPSGATAARRGEPYFLGMCSVVKDEERWLRPWLEFHTMVGVEQFFIFDDGSTDGTLDILREYERRGLVTFMGGREVWRGEGSARGLPIPDVLEQCYERVGPRVQWMMLLDPDEYAFPVDNDAGEEACSLAEYIRSRCPAEQTHLLLRWHMFGSNGFQLQPPGSLPENYFWSGGDCSTSSVAGSKHHACERPPLSYTADFCGECRHMKVVANTGGCLKARAHGSDRDAEHWPAGLERSHAALREVSGRGCVRAYVPTDPSNTDPESPRACRAAADAGATLPYGDLDEQHELMRPRPVHAAGKECCSGGIALHHYAVRSDEAVLWRKRRGFRVVDFTAPDKRAERELNAVFTPHALRFVRSLQQRLSPEQRSPGVSFHDVRGGLSCSLHRGVAFEGGARVRVEHGAASPEACCEMCAKTLRCEVWTWLVGDQTCTMRSQVLGNDGALLSRSARDGAVSGVVVVNECRI